MKFHTIRLHNLNSLKDHVEIDFDREPFLHTGLFAITGDTGAGKTTLLDAITLALYARTSRAHEKEVMSNGTSECSAEVVFSNEKGRFLARWQQKKSNRKADPLPVSRDLAQWDTATSVWKIIASGKTEVDGKGSKGMVEQLVGLNYDQFKRTILLAQGEFAAFLHSDERNRASVLERLTDTEIYARISKAAYDRQKSTKTLLDNLNKEKDLRQVLSPEEVEKLEEELAQLQIQGQEVDRQLAQYREQSALLQRLRSLAQTLAELDTREQVHTLAVAAFGPEADRLQQHRALAPLFTVAEQWKNAQHLAQSLQQSAHTANAQLEVQQAALQSATAALNTQKATALQLEQEMRSLQPLVQQAVQLDEQMAALEANVKQRQAEWAEKTEQIAALEAKQQAEANNATQWEQQLTAIADWLAQHPHADQLERILLLADEQYLPQLRNLHLRSSELEKQMAEEKPKLAVLQTNFDAAAAELAKHSAASEAAEAAWVQFLPELPAAWAALQNPDAVLAQMTAYAQRLEDFAKNFDAYWEKIRHIGQARESQEDLTKAAENILLRLFEAEDQLNWAKKNEALKRLRFERDRQILNLERDRNLLLVPGDPCPLCGSLHHPFLEEATLVALKDDAEHEWAQARTALEQAQVQYTTLTLKLNELSQDLRVIETELKSLLGIKAAALLAEGLDEEEALSLNLQAVFPLANALQEEQMLAQINAGLVLEDETHQDLYEAALRERAVVIKAQLERARQLAQQIQHTKAAYLGQDRQKSTAENALALAQARMDQWEKEYKQVQEDYQKAQAALEDALQAYGLLFSPDARFTSELQRLREVHTTYQAHLKTREQRQSDMAVFRAETELRTDTLADYRRVAQTAKAALEALEATLADRKQARMALVGVERYGALEQALDKIKAEIAAATVEIGTQEANTQALAQQLTVTTAQLAAQTQVMDDQHQTLLARTVGWPWLVPDQDLALQVLAQQLPEATLAELERRSQQLAEENTALHTLRESTQTALEQVQAQSQTVPDPDTLEQALLTTEAARKGIDQRTGALHTELDNNRRRQREAAALLEQIEQVQTQLRNQEALNKLIGSADGQAFRKFAQGLTLAQLVVLTNRHLARLQGGRYRLQTSPNTDLELEILDTFQADFVRSVKTLSGGETFLVSLALALGLADMTNRKTRIQSLFIDEGFGALDENALEMAISALEGLQSQGVMIGVITHIREMINRIDTQVKVARQSDGFSTVTIQ